MLKSLKLKNFRNLDHFEHEFTQALTLVTGPNGSGKSNLLEAIFMLGYGVSPRTRALAEIIRSGARDCRLEGFYQKGIAIYLNQRSRSYYLNHKQVSLLKFMGQFHPVLFTPTDLSLLSGAPSLRRRWLNQVLFILRPGYVRYMRDYQKALLQRNHLLRHKNSRAAHFDEWEELLAQNAAEIIIGRFELLTGLNRILAAQEQSFHLTYLPSPSGLGSRLTDLPQKEEIRDFLREKAQDLREKEKMLGYTLIGPQRDDWRAYGKTRSVETEVDLGSFASRGEQRMAVVELKLCQLALIKEQAARPEPILLLDDVFSELDTGNQVKLVAVIAQHPAIVTALDRGKIPAKFPQNSRIELRG